MVVRIISDRQYFLFGREKYWNAFDSVVVGTSVMEAIVSLSGDDLNVDASVLRTLRVLRIIRLLRVGKVFTPIRAIIHNLQCILFSLAGSAESFFSAMIMITIVLYIFGLFFMGAVKQHLSSSDEVDRASVEFQLTTEKMKEHYGSVGTSMWTLAAAVSGGVDWMDVAEPIIETGFFYRCLFLFYVVFMTIGLLNILTGIFVNVAMQSSAMSREIAVDEAISNRDAVVKEVIELFLEADEDGSGSLSWEEFEEFIKDEKIKSFFMALELDMSSVSRIFTLLDTSGDGKLEASEFVEGCIELRGMAKKVDITLLQRENAFLLEKMGSVDQILHDMKEKMDKVR